MTCDLFQSKSNAILDNSVLINADLEILTLVFQPYHIVAQVYTYQLHYFSI